MTNEQSLSRSLDTFTHTHNKHQTPSSSTDTHTFTQTHAHSHMHTHTHTHTLQCMSQQIQTHAHAHAHTHSQHARTHTFSTCTHTHTHTHTHTQAHTQHQSFWFQLSSNLRNDPNYFLPRHSRKIIFRFFDCHTFFAAMTRIPEEEHFCIFTWWRWWRWRNMKESLTSENEAPKWTAFAFLWNFWKFLSIAYWALQAERLKIIILCHKRNSRHLF